MFIGCYLLLASSLMHTITSGISVRKNNEPLRVFVCIFDIGCSGVGMNVVLATVVVKTLRIYHIFKKFGKVHHICSDLGLFVLIFSIVSAGASVKITLLIL